jgi:hypothetical protein
MDKIKSLVEARREFDTQEKCEAYLEGKRWPKGVTCPRCGSKDVTLWSLVASGSASAATISP